MDLHESIGYGHMSLNDITALINDNLTRAAEFGMRLRWHFADGGIRAVILNEKAVVFDKAYKGKYMHIHIAEMHSDWHDFFLIEKRKRRWAAMLVQAEADVVGKDMARMSMGARIAAEKKARGEDETSQVPVGED